MRIVHNPQMTFGQVDIADIEINLKSRDDIPHILLGLQYLYAVALIQDRVAENVGCRFVVTDAKSEAVSFYEKQGFVLLDSDGNQSTEHHLMFWI
ncbi:MAG: hypothetical protein EPN17_14380 [Methylobacter sp.]|nr:MAG: hypothetical protein EPN17_14380 [Methylobacter sp.]